MRGGRDIHGGFARGGGRRGMTFIEIIVASAMFAVVAAAMIGVMSATMGAQQREQQQLAASELASRLILQWLDDWQTMPEKGKPIEYAGWRFRWDFKEEPVRLVEAVQSPVEGGGAGLSNDRYLQLTARVWLGEDSGGSRPGGEGEPSAVLTRIVDPMAFRNPDSLENMWNDPVLRKQFFDRLAGFESGGTESPGAGGGRPAGGRSSGGASGGKSGGGTGKSGGGQRRSTGGGGKQ